MNDGASDDDMPGLVASSGSSDDSHGESKPLRPVARPAASRASVTPSGRTVISTHSSTASALMAPASGGEVPADEPPPLITSDSDYDSDIEEVNAGSLLRLGE
jgi:hypothetical protein